MAEEVQPEESPLRPLSPDRPDITESPHTVDEGHFQLEMDLFSSRRDQGESALSFATTNVKLGVAHFLDLQLVLRPLVSTVPAVSGGARTFGYGDPTARVKIALYGNDGGPFAIGLLPALRIPIGQSTGDVGPSGMVDRAWKAGLAVPMFLELPWELGLGAMIGTDVAFDLSPAEREFELFFTIELERALVGPLSGFVELAVRGILTDEVPAAVDVGLLYEVNEDFVLDAGAYVGVTDPAPDVVSFVGMTFRI